MADTYYARSDVPYQGGEKIFSIPFPYINKTHIKVYCNNEPITDYEYNNDNEIEVTASLEVNDIVSIIRNTPIEERLVDFSDTSILDKDVQNLDSKQSHYLVQEMYDKFGATVEEDFKQLKQDISDLKEDTQELLEESEQNVDLAKEQADRAEQYADSAEFGMKWISFTTSNWNVDSSGNYYELVMNDVPLVNSVYKGSWDSKKLIDNVDITVSSTGSVIKSHETFNGFILAATSVLGLYVHEQTLPSDEWVIDHNIGYYPQIIVMDSDNIEMICTRQHVSLNRVKLIFENMTTGKAILR